MDEEIAVTRSVEIPEEARAAGLLALHADPEWHRSDGTGVWRANYERAVNLILEAALPYLAPAVPQPVDRRAIETALEGIIPDTNEGINLRLVAADAVMELLNGAQGIPTHDVDGNRIPEWEREHFARQQEQVESPE